MFCGVLFFKAHDSLVRYLKTQQPPKITLTDVWLVLFRTAAGGFCAHKEKIPPEISRIKHLLE